MQTQRRHVARSEPTPPDEGGRETATDFAGSELQETRTASLSEGRLKASRERYIDLDRFIRCVAEETAMRCETEDHAIHRFTRPCSGRAPSGPRRRSV
jgi:hypothetical protein